MSHRCSWFRGGKPLSCNKKAIVAALIVGTIYLLLVMVSILSDPESPMMIGLISLPSSRLIDHLLQPLTDVFERNKIYDVAALGVVILAGFLQYAIPTYLVVFALCGLCKSALPDQRNRGPNCLG